MEIQEIAVYVLFALAIGYFVYRIFAKNRKKKNGKGKDCSSGDCGCS